jgi:hypothetical protein
LKRIKFLKYRAAERRFWGGRESLCTICRSMSEKPGFFSSAFKAVSAVQGVSSGRWQVDSTAAQLSNLPFLRSVGFNVASRSWTIWPMSLAMAAARVQCKIDRGNKQERRRLGGVSRSVGRKGERGNKEEKLDWR